MSRQRSENEQAVLKTVQFLQDLKHSCDNGSVFYVSVKAVNFGINKSTGKACKDLEVVKSLGDNRYKWVMANTNYRYIALLILEKLRERQQKTVEPEYLPNMQPLITAINTLTEKLTLTSNQQNKRLSEPKNASLFADQESKEAIRLKILCSITSGVYQQEFKETVCEPFSIYSPEHVHHLNNAIIAATEDLLKKFNSKS